MQEITMSRKTAAYKVHMDILAAGEVAAEAFSTFCRLLKTMRDDKLYQELEYQSFEAYCENAVGIKYRQAFNYIKVLESLGEQNLQSNAGLGIRKLELITAAPTEAREELLEKAEDMTTRQVEAAVREYKQKLAEKEKDLQVTSKVAENQARFANEYKAMLAEKEKELKEKQEWADKQAQYAEESNKRAREAEWELDKKEKAIHTLRFDLEYAKKQLAEAKGKNTSEADIKKLTDTISWQSDKLSTLQEDKEELLKQLHSKPIEAPAAKVIQEVEKVKEVIPDEIANAIYNKVASLFEGLRRLTEREIEIFAGNVIPEFCDEVVAQIREAVLVLDAIDNAVQEAATPEAAPEPEDEGESETFPARAASKACGMCQWSNPDYDEEKLENENKTWCPRLERYVHVTEETCDKFKLWEADV